eukprot:Skav233465  [mRNA]  locus=scaffold1080:261155:281392:- [translate_table: standard]
MRWCLPQATPRERQFGMYESRQRSRSQAVELPLSQLHVVAAQRQLPMLLEAVPDRDASEAIAATCLRRPGGLRLAVAVPRDQWLRSPKEQQLGVETWCDEPKKEVPMDGPEGPLIGVATWLHGWGASNHQPVTTCQVTQQSPLMALRRAQLHCLGGDVSVTSSRLSEALAQTRLAKAGSAVAAEGRGFVKRGVLAPFGSPYETPDATTSWVPERLRALVGEASLLREPSPPNSWQGDDYEPCEAEERFLQDPARLRKATVRIDEILSFEYLQLGRRAAAGRGLEGRPGESSFWVMTITAEEEKEDEETGR